MVKLRILGGDRAPAWCQLSSTLSRKPENSETGCMMGLHYCCRSSGRSAQSPRQKEGGRDWMEEVVVKVGQDATREKGVCDYGGKSLFFPLPSSPQQAPTHLAISALHKNACAILYVQVNVPKNASGLKKGHIF